VEAFTSVQDILKHQLQTMPSPDALATMQDALADTMDQAQELVDELGTPFALTAGPSGGQDVSDRELEKAFEAEYGAGAGQGPGPDTPLLTRQPLPRQASPSARPAAATAAVAVPNDDFEAVPLI
jgi:hypothetical protein